MHDACKGHVSRDCVPNEPGQSPSRLRNDTNGIHKCMCNPGNRVHSKQQCGERCSRICKRIDQSNDEEDCDVLQIVQMRPVTHLIT